MNEKALRILEYGKIRQQLADHAGSAFGRAKCLALEPKTDIGSIRRLQKETSDALNRIYKKGGLSFSGIPNIGESIKRLEIRSTLTITELLHISSVLEATLRAKNYGRGLTERDDGEPYRDSLSERFELLEPLSPAANEIRRCILSEDEIADDASAGLKDVRRRMRAANDKIHTKLSELVASQSTKTMLQDSPITMRDGRYCLPVKSEYRSQFAGMIHDQSSSGSTLFIEPIEVVKLNNELRELELAQKREIEKVLESLSSLLFTETVNLSYNADTLAEFDFIFARALLSRDMKGCEPEFNANGYVEIRKGRHPLIDHKKVVPIDIRLGDDFSMLVITGPNTGGKTVSLKTVGLFTLMGQSGLHIPAHDGSKLAVFDEVFADIGDEQSIEQSLSTFSSHMKNTVEILKEANKKSLVLFDELGAGTDPTEGAALAMAILTSLHNRDVHCLATTHYSELKVFALSTPGVSNACCEFDVETLRPTYRLMIGVPGKSNAFAISTRLGLGSDVIDMAESFIGTRDKSFEDLITELDNMRIKTESDLDEAARMRAEAEEIRDSYEKKLARFEEQREKRLRDANEEAREILEDAKEYADEVIRKMNKFGKGGSNRDAENARNELRGRISSRDEALTVKKKKPKGKTPDELKVGDSVHVLSFNVNGKVASLPDARGNLFVMIGAMRTKVNMSDLEEIDGQEEFQRAGEKKPGSGKKSSDRSGSIAAEKSMSVSVECNVIGMHVDEALIEVDKYLDDAYLAHLPKVTVIHGRGTGALRDAIHQKLRRTKYVKSYRLGSFGEGEHGVTIVEFK